MRGETFIVLFAEKLTGALWGVVGYRAYQRGEVFAIVLCVGVAAAFTWWRTKRVSAKWVTR